MHRVSHPDAGAQGASGRQGTFMCIHIFDHSHRHTRSPPPTHPSHLLPRPLLAPRLLVRHPLPPAAQCLAEDQEVGAEGRLGNMLVPQLLRPVMQVSGVGWGSERRGTRKATTEGHRSQKQSKGKGIRSGRGYHLLCTYLSSTRKMSALASTAPRQ